MAEKHKTNRKVNSEIILNVNNFEINYILFKKSFKITYILKIQIYKSILLLFLTTKRGYFTFTQ